MANYLTLPSGRPNPYAPPVKQYTDPWAGSGYDPTQKFTTKQSGSLANARSGLMYAAQKGWGRDLTEGDYGKLAQHIGYTSGDVSSDQYNAALDGMEGVLGARPPVHTGGPDPQPPPPPAPGVPSSYRAPGVPAPIPQSFQPAAPLTPNNPYAQQQQQLMSKILANPQTMDQNFQDQLSERQKESAMRMGAQGQEQARQALAGRGLSGQGGAQQQIQAQGQQDLMSQILGGRRDIATQAVTQNRQDGYAALNQSGQLQGQAFDEQSRAHGQNFDQAHRVAGQNLNEFLGVTGADQNRLNYEENRSQFNRNYGLDFMRYLAQREQFRQSLGENGRQFNAQQGFNWASLSAQQQQQMMDRIFGQQG